MAGRPSISQRQIMQSVPARNEAVHEQAKGEDEVLLFVPLRDKWFMKPPFSWVLPLSRERVVNLDRLGTKVWRFCDGQSTVEQIVERFSRERRLGFQEAWLLVGQFLQDLMRRDLIVLVGREGETGDGGSA